MKRFLAVLIVLFIAITLTGGRAQAATPPVNSGPVGPYEGTFTGYAYGNRGSRAPITLELTHRGDTVSGVVELGQGLFIDGGICGGAYVPTSQQPVTGNTVTSDPTRLEAKTGFKINNLQISVDFSSQVSPDGKTVMATAKIDLPWLCGRDPTITGTVSRDSTL
jgi:hypothetical protein